MSWTLSGWQSGSPKSEIPTTFNVPPRVATRRGSQDPPPATPLVPNKSNSSSIPGVAVVVVLVVGVQRTGDEMRREGGRIFVRCTDIVLLLDPTVPPALLLVVLVLLAPIVPGVNTSTHSVVW